MEEQENRKNRWPIGKVAVAVVLVVLTALVLYSLSVVSDIRDYVQVNRSFNQDILGSLSGINSKLDALPEPTEGIHDTNGHKAIEETPSYTQEELSRMVIGRKFDDLMTVALSPNATEIHLILIAQECVNVIGSDTDKLMPLVVALVHNPNCTTAVVTTLANINYYEVWLVVAQSDLCSEATLLLLAKHCNPYTSSAEHNLLVPVVSAICENGAISEYVLNELNQNYYAHINVIVQAKLIELTQPEHPSKAHQQ